jgi:predicted thioredoxin/glutaredoxin
MRSASQRKLVETNRRVQAQKLRAVRVRERDFFSQRRRQLARRAAAAGVIVEQKWRLRHSKGERSRR